MRNNDENVLDSTTIVDTFEIEAPELDSEEELDEQDEEKEFDRQLKVDELLTKLNKFGKGERSTPQAKAVRRALRKLGHYISKQPKMVTEATEA